MIIIKRSEHPNVSTLIIFGHGVKDCPNGSPYLANYQNNDMIKLLPTMQLN